MQTRLVLKAAVVENHAMYISVLTKIGPGDWDSTTFPNDTKADWIEAVEYARAWNRQYKLEGRA